MKKCPQCGREYDLSMSFCLDDGVELLYGPASMDEPATAILHETTSQKEAATRSQIGAAEAEPRGNLGDSSERQSLPAHRAAKPQNNRNKIFSIFGVAVFLLVGGFPSLAVARFYAGVSLMRRGSSMRVWKNVSWPANLTPLSSIIARQIVGYYLFKRDHVRAMEHAF